ncbi:MAG: VWA domain-containing protein [Acidobacteriota bacterium]
MRRITGALLVTLAISGLPLVSNAEEVSEKAGVTLVEVPVYATDRDGKPVVDLRMDEFVVEEDGKPQEVLFVQRIVAGQPADEAASRDAGDASALPPEGGALAVQRHFVLVFDLTFNTLEGLGRARQSAWRFVTEKLAPDEKVAVFSISRTKGLRMCSNFTSDRGRLAEAIADLVGTGADGMLERSAGLVERPVSGIDLADARMPGLGAAPASTDGLEVMLANLPPQIADNIQHVQRFDRFALRTAVLDYLETLRNLALSLNVLPGRKIVILFSTGFDAGKAFFNEEDALSGMGTNYSETMDTTARIVDSASLDQAKAVMGYFSTSDCRLFAVDAAPTAGFSVDGGSTVAHQQATAQRASQDSLAILASEAGGRFFKAASAPDRTLGVIEEETRQYYLLAYTPPAGEEKGAYHDIRVKVSRPGLTIVNRKGYYDRKPFNAYSPLEKDLQVAEILHNNRELTHIELSSLPLGFPARPPTAVGLTQVLLHLFLPGPPNSRVLGRDTEAFVFASDADGKIVDFFRSKWQIANEEQMERARRAGMSCTEQLFLRPGSYTLKVVVRNVETGAAGSRNLQIVVPDFNRATLFMATPSFLSSGSGSLAISSLFSQKPASQGESTNSSYPLTLAGKTYVPAIAPEMAPQQEIPVFLKLYNVHLDPKTSKPHLQLRWLIESLNGTAQQQADCRPDRHSISPDGSADFLFLFKPPQLDPGDHLLRVMVEDSVSGESASGALYFQTGGPSQGR